MTRILALLALFTLSLSTAAAQFGDVIYHYDGDMQVDVDSGEIAVDWRIGVLDDGASTITFLLGASLGNISVDGDVASHQIAPQGPFQAIVLELGPATTAGPREILLSYDGLLFPEPPANDINAISPDRVELTVDGFWLPLDASFQGYLTADLRVDVGAPWHGVANGSVERLPTGVRVINEEASLDIAFTLAPAFHTTRFENFTLYDLRETHGGIDRLTGAASFCIDHLNALYGARDALPYAHFVIHRRVSSAYNRRSYITLTDIAETDDERLTQFVCHELAHHWSVGANFNTVENWLNESFAEYAGNMALRDRFGEDAFAERMGRYLSRIEDQDLPPIWVPGATDRRPYLVNYRAGPVALWHLESWLGRPTFQTFMTRYMTDGIDTTPELLAMLEDLAGEEARNWFQARLAMTGTDGWQSR
jgi:Peptidase family M1 domain